MKDTKTDYGDLNYQLGMYVGEYITFKYLPTLSTDMLRTHTTVEVSEEDSEKHKQIHDVLVKSYASGNSDEKFNEFRNFNEILARKYLPEKLKCMVPKVTFTNEKMFLEGLKHQIWDTDLSWYWPQEDFYKKGHELGWSDTIILTLKINN